MTADELAASPITEPLRGLRVVQADGGIEVAYCTKLLADAGADVLAIEPVGGHPLRRRRPLGIDSPGPSPLFSYLHTGKHIVAGTDLDDACAEADVVVTDRLRDPWAVIHARHPRLTVVAITAFGLDGPWSDRPASDLTLQALSGGMAPRGDRGREPLMVGGEPTAWFAGAVAATSLLGVLPRLQATAVGELLDVSQLECAHLEHTMYPVTFASIAGHPFHRSRGVPVPGIEPTADGYVGFFVITGQQWLDFCALIERPEWADDEELFIALERRLRNDQLQPAIRAWTTARTTSEIVEIASLLRIPVAPIGNGHTIPEIDHFVDQQWLVTNPDGFVQPRRPYRFAGEPVLDTTSPPKEVTGRPLWQSAERAVATPAAGDLPLAGVRVADFTAFWAGPLAAQILAGLGAEVIHIEGPRRPDGIRMNSIRRLDEDQWWEWSPLFMGANTDKCGIAVDLSVPDGREIALRLLATCDVMLENFSPRVVEQLGLGPSDVHAANARLAVVRMPAFGLSGPWRDRVGFAQTIEQASGLAFLTGYGDEAPVIPNGMCDPVAAVHGAYAALLALRQRELSGRGQVIEAPMIGAALATAAEQVVEYSANGTLLTSHGNGSPFVDQAVFGCRGDDEWVAITMPSEGRARLNAATGSADAEALTAWCAARPASEIVELCDRLGLPAARVTWAHEIITNPQLIARGFFEEVDHPVVGRHPYVSFPVRISGGPAVWNRTAAPTLGGDNGRLLRELGYTADDIDRLTADGVVADRVLTSQHGW